MGTRGKDDDARIDYSEGAPPAASAFANGAAEALGASRMDDEEEGDWDSDEEEQAELAAAEAAAKGKVCSFWGGRGYEGLLVCFRGAVQSWKRQWLRQLKARFVVL